MVKDSEVNISKHFLNLICSYLLECKFDLLQSLLNILTLLHCLKVLLATFYYDFHLQPGDKYGYISAFISRRTESLVPNTASVFL
jgi:hypothetical protein